MKLIKDCKVGDTLYYASNTDGRDFIAPVVIEEIKRGSWLEPDTYICKSVGCCDFTYEFKHENSDHDSLILDTDYAYSQDDKDRFFTTYDAAVSWLMIELKYGILQKLSRLEKLEKQNGVKKDIFQKKTIEGVENYQRHKKIVIYDICSDESIKHVNRVLEGKKVKVYKKLIETNHRGDTKYSGNDIFVKDFDCMEDALEYIHENDNSRSHGEMKRWYEGETYFIKED